MREAQRPKAVSGCDSGESRMAPVGNRTKSPRQASPDAGPSLPAGYRRQGIGEISPLRSVGAAAVLLGLVLSLTGAETEEVRTPEKALAGLKVRDGLECTLFAAEPLLLSPSNIDVDHRGRVWVCEVVNYRGFRNKHPFREAGDRILILEDTTGDGRADSQKVFYQGPDIDSAHGVCVLGNQVIVSAGDKVQILTDTDGDDRADDKRTLFSGISGTQHDHGIHSFLFGPDGRLYFNFGNAGGQLKDASGQPIIDQAGNLVGSSRQPYQEGMVFRCEMDGSNLETLAWNFRNNWEVCVDSFGTLWQSDNDDDGNRAVRINFVMEGGNYGYKDELTGAGWRTPRVGMREDVPSRHWHLNDPGVMPNLLQTGAGSPTGIMIYEGSLLPDVFRNELIHTDAGPNIVRSYPVEPAGAGYTATIENMLEGDQDKWFRPSDVCVAPDGSLIVADWYDPGVGGHKMEDASRGRLFRLAPPGAKWSVPKVDLTTAEGAAAALTSPNLATRYLAWQKLHSLEQQAEPVLEKLFTEHDNPRMQARALWLLGQIPGRGPHWVQQALASENADLRITGLRLGRRIRLPVSDLVSELSSDPSPAVRRECAVALRTVSDEAVVAPLWVRLASQHAAGDRWSLEALGIAARGRWDTCLGAWLKSVGEKWNTPAGREIIWRSRGQQTASLLRLILADPQLPSADVPKYLRAFDFVPAEGRRDVLAQLAFATEIHAFRRNLVMKEGL
ncbi:MAG: PQQ-dependent sugar dehydrogenase, partial [Planctomycetaceae bacterium]|nr:PQQ-dependent sugar dehydrogenase [Planctomycetaceae bacterium]